MISARLSCQGVMKIGLGSCSLCPLQVADAGGCSKHPEGGGTPLGVRSF